MNSKDWLLGKLLASDRTAHDALSSLKEARAELRAQAELLKRTESTLADVDRDRNRLSAIANDGTREELVERIKQLSDHKAFRVDIRQGCIAWRASIVAVKSSAGITTITADIPGSASELRPT